jgi:antitoxin VapB
METKTAKLFVNGGSQAVRLPAEFRFVDTDEVFVRRDAVTGHLVLSAKRSSKAWQDFFSLRDQHRTPTDFLFERPLNEVLKQRGNLRDR